MSVMTGGGEIPAYGRPNWVEVDVGAVTANLAAIRRRVGPAVKIFVALKGNAYGFGYIEAARLVADLDVDAVATVDLGEAAQIRQSGLRLPILVYAGNLLTQETVAAIERFDLTPTVHDRASAAALARFATRRIAVYIEINVGGERFGIDAAEAPQFVSWLHGLPQIEIAGAYSHMHVPQNDMARQAVQRQFDRFRVAVEAVQRAGIAVPVRMIASSQVLILTSRMALDAVDLGHLVFGLDPGGPHEIALEVRPALLALKSRLVAVQCLARQRFLEDTGFPARDGLRYGVIPMGSADRLPLVACEDVLVRGRRVSFLGKPFAEHARVDLTAIPEAEVGDEVIIIGHQGEEEITLGEIQRHRGGVRASDVTRAIPVSIPRRYLSPVHAETAFPRRKIAG